MGLGLILKNPAPPPSLTVDYWIDMEAGNDGDVLTTDLVTAGIKGAGLTPSIPTALTVMKVATAAEIGLPGNIKIGGVTYTDSGTRGWAVQMSSGNQQEIKLALPTPKLDVSVGGFWTCTAPDDWASAYDTVMFRDVNDRGSIIANLVTQGGSGNLIRVETLPGGVTTWGDVDIPITPPGTVYWMTALYHSAASGSLLTMRLYDPTRLGTPSAWTLLGESKAVLDNNVAAAAFFIGIDIAGGTNNGYIRYYDWLIDTTDATFPLLPPSP